MTSNKQKAYLAAMGIPLWESRDKAASPDHSIVSTEITGKARLSDVQDDSWAQVADEVSDCKKCALCESRNKTVFGVGSKNADWMVIGEAPGADEDKEGEPFIGRGGQLLTNIFKAAGFEREQLFIANILKCRPPNNRDPAESEVQECLPYLERQIRLLQPKMIIAVGRIAAQRLLKSDMPIGKMRLNRFEYQQHEMSVPLVVTYHPAYLLRSPRQKRKAWEDMRFALSVYQDVCTQ